MLIIPLPRGSRRRGMFFSSGSWSSRFRQFADRIGFCRVPEMEERLIFDSAILDFVITTDFPYP